MISVGLVIILPLILIVAILINNIKIKIILFFHLTSRRAVSELGQKLDYPALNISIQSID
jgi:hypothetical protein